MRYENDYNYKSIFRKAWPFFFRVLPSSSEGCTGIFKKMKKIMTPWGSVTAGDEMLRFNFKNLEVGLGEKTDPISRAIPHIIHSRVADDGGLMGRQRKYHR